MVKRILLLMLTGIVLANTLAQAQLKDEYWNQISHNEKIHFITTDYTGRKELSIMCFAVTQETMDLLGVSTMKQAIENTLGSHCLMVYVAPYGNEYFWPTSFVFTQNRWQYEVGYSEFVGVTDAFNGGELKSGTVASGVVRIPEGIDPNEIFTLWYNDESASLGPIFFDSPSTQLILPPLEVTLSNLPSTIRKGEVLSVEVETVAGAICTITVFTSTGQIHSPEFEDSVASSTGKSFWSWKIPRYMTTGLILFRIDATLGSQQDFVLGSILVVE